MVLVSVGFEKLAGRRTGIGSNLLIFTENSISYGRLKCGFIDASLEDDHVNLRNLFFAIILVEGLLVIQISTCYSDKMSVQ